CAPGSRSSQQAPGTPASIRSPGRVPPSHLPEPDLTTAATAFSSGKRAVVLTHLLLGPNFLRPKPLLSPALDPTGGLRYHLQGKPPPARRAGEPPLQGSGGG